MMIARSTIFSVAMTFCSTITKTGPGLLIDLAQALHDVAHDHRRKTGRRLVKQQPLRPRHQRHPERKHLLLAAAQRARALCAPLVEHGEYLEHAVDEADIEKKTRDVQVLLDGQVREYIVPLRHERDAPLHILRDIRFDPDVVVQHLAFGRRHRADHAFQQRSLAGAVVPEDADAGARLDRENDPLQRRERSVFGAHMVDLEHAAAQVPK